MQALAEGFLNNMASRIETRIEVDSAKDRLECIGQYRIPPVSATLALATTQVEMLTETELRGNLGECRIIDQRCPEPTQISLGSVRMCSEHDLRYHEVEDGVAEKLETLVVVARRTTVGQRKLKELRIRKFVVEGVL